MMSCIILFYGVFVVRDDSGVSGCVHGCCTAAHISVSTPIRDVNPRHER